MRGYILLVIINSFHASYNISFLPVLWAVSKSLPFTSVVMNEDCLIKTSSLYSWIFN